jgi:hypothetical protein
MSVKINSFAFFQELSLSFPATGHISVSALHSNPLCLRNTHVPTNVYPNISSLPAHSVGTTLRIFFLLHSPLSTTQHILAQWTLPDGYAPAGYSAPSLLLNLFVGTDYIFAAWYIPQSPPEIFCIDI